MEVIKNLLIRIRHTGVLFLIGFILIVYIALGFLYWQQGEQQSEYEKQIAKLSLILLKPLPSAEQLQTEYEAVNLALAPMKDVDAIALLVSIAEENGIDVDEASGKFRVPTVTTGNARVGTGTYKVSSFNGIRVEGEYDNVMAFISDLNSGKTLNNMVLKKVNIKQVVVSFTGEENTRRAEFRSVISAVEDMMTDNDLDSIPYPMNYAGGVAINSMGDDPNTEEVEGFPDIITTAAEKGYSGNATVSAGYVLYNHDIISMENTNQFNTVSYMPTLTTKYYYTCEADGTVRQFDDANVSTATEYTTSEPSKIGLVANVAVDIYFKP